MTKREELAAFLNESLWERDLPKASELLNAAMAEKVQSASREAALEMRERCAKEVEKLMDGVDDFTVSSSDAARSIRALEVL